MSRSSLETCLFQLSVQLLTLFYYSALYEEVADYDTIQYTPILLLYSVMGMSLKVTTPIKISLTLINSDVHCILCRVYNRVDSSDISIDVLVFQIF